MQISFNQIKRTLQEIAEKHQQVNSFGLGDIWEIAASSAVTYPLMYAHVQPSSYSDKYITLRFSLLFMDLVHKDERNEDEVLSDMLRVAVDVKNILASEYFDFVVEENGSLESFTENFSDEVAGWKMDISIRIADLKDLCAIPLDGNISTDTLCADVIIKDEDGNVIATVPSGGVYVVTGGGGICSPATVRNSDSSYTQSVNSGGTLVLPDSEYLIYVNGDLNQQFTAPSLKDLIINIS
jgi:hypothetical protein